MSERSPLISAVPASSTSGKGFVLKSSTSDYSVNPEEGSEEILDLDGHLTRKNGATFLQGFSNFAKGMLGAGILAIPSAIAKSGVILGIIGYAVITLLVTYSMLSLIKVAHKLRERGHKNIVTYGDVAFAALGRPGKIVVEVLVIALELVFCSGFVIVVGECLQQSFPVLPYWAWVLVSSPILIGLSWIDQLKDLWLVAFVGVGVYIVGVIGGTMYYSTVNLLHPANSHKPEMFVFDTLSLFFGTVVYSMEGINLVMPIESGLRRPSHSYPIIGIGTVLYAAFCCGYGVVAYLAGLGDCDNVIQCLPSSWIRTTIEIALVLALFSTHAITLYPATEMLELALFSPTTRLRTVKSRTLRTFLVLITIGVAAGVGNHFDLFSSLFGSLGVGLVGFIIPPILVIVTFYPDVPLWECCVNSFLVLSGLTAMGLGTYQSVMNLIE